jgi:hypothetical protein
LKGGIGLSRSSILGGVARGEASATNVAFGDWGIDYREFSQIYPSFAESADGAATPGSRDAPSLEADIAALVKDAVQSARAPEDEIRSVRIPQLRVVPPSHAEEFAANQPKNIEVKVNESYPQRRSSTDIRLRDPARAAQAVSSRNAHRTRAALAVLLGLAIGWVAVLPLSYIKGLLPAAGEQSRLPATDVPRNQTVPGPAQTGSDAAARRDDGGKTGGATPGHRRRLAQGAAQPKAVKTSLVALQGVPAFEPAAADVERRPDAPFPETKPATIPGWIVRDVYGATAVLEGPDGGVWRAARGDNVPSLGRLESIVRWGDRWIVATEHGLISTP